MRERERELKGRERSGGAFPLFGEFPRVGIEREYEAHIANAPPVRASFLLLLPLYTLLCLRGTRGVERWVNRRRELEQPYTSLIPTSLPTYR